MIKVKDTVIEIVKGDITKFAVDAIVNPANCSMRMETGLSGLIKKRGGESIEKEAVKKAPVKSGDVISTKAGKLHTKYVIHTVTVDAGGKTDQTILRQAAASALARCEELKLKSIAIPALGCGAGGFPVAGAAKIMTQEILKLIRKQKTSVRKIIFCLYDDDTFKVFDKTIRAYIRHLQDDLGWGPYVTVDAIIEMPGGVVLIERSNPPYGWALPGGFLDYGESLEEGIAREVKEETNLELEGARQFHTYSKPGRDPRFQTVSTVFVGRGKGVPRSGDDAKGLKIVPYLDLLKLECAFDHKQVIKDYLDERNK